MLKFGTLLSFDNKLTDDSALRACRGITDIHEYSNLDAIDLSKGNIKEMINGTIYFPKSGLDVIEILDIANEAKNAKYLDAYVEWLVIALRRSKKDKENSKFIRKIR